MEKEINSSETETPNSLNKIEFNSDINNLNWFLTKIRNRNNKLKSDEDSKLND